jgi:hypothetical protein
LINCIFLQLNKKDWRGFPSTETKRGCPCGTIKLPMLNYFCQPPLATNPCWWLCFLFAELSSYYIWASVCPNLLSYSCPCDDFRLLKKSLSSFSSVFVSEPCPPIKSKSKPILFIFIFFNLE